MPDVQDMTLVLQRMLQKLIAEYAPEKVILFGSYAYGVSGPDSDIDLLIIKETADRFLDRWTTVQRILAGTHRTVPVETLVLTPQEIAHRLTIGDQCIAEILQQGKVVYAA
jgi:predicted nucleotidyltransferase